MIFMIRVKFSTLRASFVPIKINRISYPSSPVFDY